MPKRLNFFGRAVVIAACLLLGAAPGARAEKADKEKPINFSAEQPAEVDFEKRIGALKGNVVITQGTLTISRAMTTI